MRGIGGVRGVGRDVAWGLHAGGFMFLTEDEIRELTRRKVHRSQTEALRSMGISHKVRPDGSVAVLKSHVEKTLDGLPEKARMKEWQPDWSSLNASPPQS